VSGGEGVTEIQWDRWEKGNAMKKLKIHTNSYLQTPKRRRSLGVLGLDGM
jgi:hypothetical protein